MREGCTLDGGGRPGPRHDDEGGPALRPRRAATSRSAAPRAASTATRGTRGRTGSSCAICGPMRPYIESCWTTGEDLGLTQDLVDRGRRRGRSRAPPSRPSTRCSTTSSRPARAARGRLRRRGRRHRPRRAGRRLRRRRVGARGARPGRGAVRRERGSRVQGLGTMGGATARFLARAGLKIVAVADVKGTIANPDGPRRRGAARRPGRVRHGRPLGAARPATANCRATPGCPPRPRCWSRPPSRTRSTPPTRRRSRPAGSSRRPTCRCCRRPRNCSRARGVTVLPDVVVNSGTNAWWWWTLFGDIGADADEAFAHTRRSMRALIDQMLARAEADGTTPRAAAHAHRRRPAAGHRRAVRVVRGLNGP